MARYLMAMEDRFTERAKRAMAHARLEAQFFKHEYLGAEHLLLGLPDNARRIIGDSHHFSS